MNKQWAMMAAGLALLQGCATVDRGAVPVVDAGAPVSEASGRQVAQQAVRPAAPAVAADDVVMVVPQAIGAPLQTFPAPATAPLTTAPAVPAAPAPSESWSAPVPSAPPVAPSGIPSGGSGGLAPDEQLEGPVLALLTSARQLQDNGDLSGAASSLERAQRIAPREPQVLYRLAQVRLGQGDAAQAEQLSRRALSYAAGRPALQASLWELIAQARERQGDAAGAEQARQRARVSL
ncbi:tetratricopeptide repeat protein [Stutzerimonas tarimensis]|uniref:Tetratricopeptide repeat protein n=1 Tax=Stutzerimonas tarimensis TaxID=1507735 RepID=A0ABV7T498_9GAMM